MEAKATGVVIGGGVRRGLNIKTSATNAPKPLVHCSGKAFTNIRMSLAPQRPDNSLFRQLKPKKCIIPKHLAEAARIL